MAEWLVSLLSLAFVSQVLRITMPYALAAMGGVVSERSGVINIALEGMLLMGAFGAAVGAYDSDNSVLVALLYGVGAGVATRASGVAGASNFAGSLAGPAGEGARRAAVLSFQRAILKTLLGGKPF